MELSIQEILKKRIEAYKNNTLKEHFVFEGKEYQKKWADAVEHFRIAINKDRKKENQPPLSFIVIRMKLCHVREIDDLRWFYIQCLKYSKRKKENTFSKCFFGSLKLK